jgi:hypothetical protein
MMQGKNRKTPGGGGGALLLPCLSAASSRSGGSEVVCYLASRVSIHTNLTSLLWRKTASRPSPSARLQTGPVRTSAECASASWGSLVGLGKARGGHVDCCRCDPTPAVARRGPPFEAQATPRHVSLPLSVCSRSHPNQSLSLLPLAAPGPYSLPIFLLPSRLRCALHTAAGALFSSPRERVRVCVVESGAGGVSGSVVVVVRPLALPLRTLSVPGCSTWCSEWRGELASGI